MAARFYWNAGPYCTGILFGRDWKYEEEIGCDTAVVACREKLTED